MELIIALLFVAIPIILVMLVYFFFFKLQEGTKKLIRGEHKVSNEPALLRKYREKQVKTIPISGSSVDLAHRHIPAFIPEKSTHALVLGKSGCGKSTLVEALAQAYLQLPNHNIIVIEPHMSLCESMAKWGSHYGKTVTYIDLALTSGMVVPWNPLKTDQKMNAEKAASFLLGCFDDKFNVFGTVQQAEALRAGFVLLAENDLTLDYFSDLFYKDFFRNSLLQKSNSCFCTEYFERYEQLSPSQKDSRALPAINKVSLLLQDEASRLMLCQNSQYSISLSQIINDGNSILLICLNRGANPTVSDLLGSIFLSALKNAIFQRRANDSSYPMTHLFCDEFPAFMSPATGSVLLAESRKYRIDVVFISQFLQVSDQRFKHELVQNTSLQMIFQMDLDEAKIFGNKISQDGADKIGKLPPYDFYFIDKNIQDHMLFVTKPVRTPNISVNYAYGRPVNQVQKELEAREKQKKQSSNNSSSSFGNFRSKFRRTTP